MKNRKCFLRAVLASVMFFTTLCASAQKSDFKYKVNNNSVTITGWKGKGSHIVIPDAINGMPVEVIDADIFNLKIKSVVLPANLKRIAFRSSLNNTAKRNAFYVIRSSPLSVIDIPSNLGSDVELLLPHWFSTSFVAHGRQSGTYTLKNGIWYLDGNPPQGYAVFSTYSRDMTVLYLNGENPDNFCTQASKGIASYMLPSGSHVITYESHGLEGSPTIDSTVFLEEGKSWVEVVWEKASSSLFLGDKATNVSLKVEKK